ncbi:hypothetical protein DFP72DRAFT_854128 [Ephemerocybe angulata]|uniref:Uncharacterized protein n=1 Tax=Ephemerocybe angulata TaxID=980116 RepID=A0A8H6HIN5_9AGAR|nr:hypothetical protein DFP72DRAFT_854128 [Tulosesus angulatus]
MRCISGSELRDDIGCQPQFLVEMSELRSARVWAMGCGRIVFKGNIIPLSQRGDTLHRARTRNRRPFVKSERGAMVEVRGLRTARKYVSTSDSSPSKLRVNVPRRQGGNTAKRAGGGDARHHLFRTACGWGVVIKPFPRTARRHTGLRARISDGDGYTIGAKHYLIRTACGSREIVKVVYLRTAGIPQICAGTYRQRTGVYTPEQARSGRWALVKRLSKWVGSKLRKEMWEGDAQLYFLRTARGQGEVVKSPSELRGNVPEDYTTE